MGAGARSRSGYASAVFTLLFASAGFASAGTSFVNFESGHVRPLALAGGVLFAVNTPDNRLEMFAVGEDGLTPAGEVSVGLEPVAVAARNVLCFANGKCPIDAYVVNHLSDSVTALSLVYDVAARRVDVAGVATLQTCDEPRDIVLAGPGVKHKGPGRIFVTAARRGQNCPFDAKLLEKGVPRGLVQVFDTESLAEIGTLELFTDTPRALASSPDGKRVYAAGFLSGNLTSVVSELTVRFNGGLPPAPQFATADAPNTGIIVKYDPTTKRWLENGLRPPATTPKDWSGLVPRTLADDDVFAIDAMASPPVVWRQIQGVGTVIDNLAVRPVWKITPAKVGVSARDQIFASNTQALNERRFEPVLRGHVVENRITVLSGVFNVRILRPPGSGNLSANPFSGWSFGVRPVHLNPHIDYTCLPPLCLPPPSEVDASLALPTDLVFSHDGKTVYLAAFGSGAVAILDAEQVSQGNASNREIVRVGGGPSGLALDEVNDRLYVMDRFDNSIATVDLAGAVPTVSALRMPLYDPSPQGVKDGRPFLYDARHTSAHGDQACASCHVFGDFDGLAWDLGNPFGNVQTNCNDFVNAGGPGQVPKSPVHPMKGPMTTQSLRGMAEAGPLHWRGDRSGCDAAPNSPEDSGQYDEVAAFKKFNGAFVSLLGRTQELDTTSNGDLDKFTTFALSLRYPPNPIRPFDDFSAEAKLGRDFFEQIAVDGQLRCNDCHALPLGTNTKSSEEGEAQQFKIAHLRNLYQKAGMFGVEDILAFAGFPATGPVGDQVRGFGYLHDGSIDTVDTFLHFAGFQFPLDEDRDHVTRFMFEFDPGLAPIVGQQVTRTANDNADVSFLSGRADAGDCDLVARGRPNSSLGSREQGFVYEQRPGDATRFFYADSASAPKQTLAQLEASIQGTGWLTFTCVPPGEGGRVGIDRDCDTVLDGDDTSTPDPIAYPSTHCP